MTEQTGPIWTNVLGDHARTTHTVPSESPRHLATGEQLELRDLRIATPVQPVMEDRKHASSKVLPYRLADDCGSGWAIWGGTDAPEFAVDPKLEGWYAVFFSVYRPGLQEHLKHGGTTGVKLSSDEFWTPLRPNESREIVCPRPAMANPYSYTGDDRIELELFLCVAQLDGERVHIKNENVCVTALRFVALAPAQVDDYRADLGNPATRRVIINLETYGSIGYLASWIDRYGKSDVGTIHMEFSAGVVDNVLYSGSKYTDSWGSAVPDSLMPCFKPMFRNWMNEWRSLHATGGTLFDIAGPAARRAGITVMASSRMDIYWGDEKDPGEWRKDSLDDYPIMWNGRFYRKHPELRLPGHRNLDYYHPQVRARVIDIFCEAAEKLDVDGMSMDFTRWPPFIRRDADAGIMVDFIKEMRTRLDAVGKRKGRRLALAAELVDGMYIGLTLPEQRVDVEAWLASGALDYLVIEGQDKPFYTCKPDKGIGEYIALGKRLGVPVYPRNDMDFTLELPPEQCAGSTPLPPPGVELGHDPYWGDEFDIDPMANANPRCGSLHYQMGASGYYEMGAERVVLSNRIQGELGMRRLGHADELRGLNRTGQVFGQREGQTVHWEEQVESSLELAGPGRWKNGAAKGTVRLTMKNTGRAPSSGTVKLTASPADVMGKGVPDDIRYYLEPGQSLARDIPVEVSISGLAIRADCDDPAFVGCVLKWRPEAWLMTSVPPLDSLNEIPRALSSERWQIIHWYRTPTAAVRIAAAGDAFAVQARVQEPRGLLSCSRFDLFASVQGASEVFKLAFLPVRSDDSGKEQVRLSVHGESVDVKEFPCEINIIPEGYELKALIPRAIFGIGRDQREFNLDFMATTGAADFGSHANCLVGTERRQSLIRVIIA